MTFNTNVQCEWNFQEHEALCIQKTNKQQQICYCTHLKMSSKFEKLDYVHKNKNVLREN